MTSMKIAYFDCMSGISGDMCLGALVDAGVPFEALDQAIQSLGLPNVNLQRDAVQRHGFRATKIHVRHKPEHAHRHLHDIEAIIDQSELSGTQQRTAKRIFEQLAKAEAKVHGTTPDKVHFHEVGAVDSIADICGVAVGLDLLEADRIECSPIPTGTGFIQIAHGRVSVPAPATADLLTGIPLAHSDVKAELTTPTGAAIVSTMADRFGSLPEMRIARIGYGAGDRDLESQANVLRLIVGEANDVATSSDEVWVLETNLDDCSAEWVGHCVSQLWELPILDVYTSSISMKKNRPATKLTVLVQKPQIAQVEELIFRETTTIGLRKWPVQRSKLEREPYKVDTRWGSISGQRILRPGAGMTFAPEYESCRQVAEANKISLSRVYDAARDAFRDTTARHKN